MVVDWTAWSIVRFASDLQDRTSISIICTQPKIQEMEFWGSFVK